MEGNMDSATRRQLRQRLPNASRATLLAAVIAVLDTDADAQKGVVDDPEDKMLGWFADGTDTAAGQVFAAVMGYPAESAVAG
jgi:hypothetical protein